MEEVSENSENIHMSTKESTMRIDLMKIMMKVWLIASTLTTTVSWSQAQQSTDTNPAMNIFQGIIYWVGVAFIGFCVFWCLSRLIHRVWIKKIAPKTCPENMPLLKPIPIPTKGRNALAQLLVWIIEPRRWKVMKDWCFQFKKKNGKIIKFVIPKSFVFDGASIPRLFWFFLSPTGLLLIPGLIHDYGYKYNQLWELNGEGNIVPFKPPEKRQRLYWDRLFFKIGIQVNGVHLPNIFAWVAVVCFGCGAWRKHKKGGRKKATKPQTPGQCSPSAACSPSKSVQPDSPKN